MSPVTINIALLIGSLLVSGVGLFLLRKSWGFTPGLTTMNPGVDRLFLLGCIFVILGLGFAVVIGLDIIALLSGK